MMSYINDEPIDRQERQRLVYVTKTNLHQVNCQIGLLRFNKLRPARRTNQPIAPVDLAMEARLSQRARALHEQYKLLKENL